MQFIDEYNIFMSPLDDPVFGAIYANADVAGLAMESTERGFRVDVEVLTDTNEWWVIEVQVNTDRNILLRNLVVALT